jgi:hypothetical protein
MAEEDLEMKMLPGKRLLRNLVRLAVLVATALVSPSLGQAQVRADPGVEPLPRVAITSAVSVAATAAVIGGGVAAGLGTARRCNDYDYSGAGALGCGIAGGAVLLGVSLGVMPVALTLSSYLTHRALDGRGRWYAALAGAGVGLAAGTGVLSLTLSSKDDQGLLAGTIIGGLIAASVPVLALELSHGRVLARERRAQTSARSRIMPVASALPNGGAWLGLSGTL